MTEERSSDLVAFATLGIVLTAQQLSISLLAAMPGADPETVSEESMTLVATLTARALAETRVPSEALAHLPLLYRDYAVGSAMLDGDELPSDADPYSSLSKMLEFYEAHLPSGQNPGPDVIQEKMELWMGRVSPPGLADSPTDRLRNLELVELVLTHLKLVQTMASQR